MTTRADYKDYVTDEAFLTKYNDYQKQFRTEARECDKILIEMIGAIARDQKSQKPLRLLDIGCSTANVLLHLRRLMPQLELTGGDLAESSLEVCRQNKDLAGVAFEKLDLLLLPPTAAYDIIVVNAVLYMMTDAQVEAALDSIRGALAPNGTLLVFDFFHPFDQQLAIIEKSDSHPEGLPISFRPQALVSEWLDKHGFEKIEYHPFTLPIDLPQRSESGLPSYTVKTAEGVRLPFRGTLFQPWCHMSATKS